MAWNDLYLQALANGHLQATARRIAGVSKREYQEYRAAYPVFAEEEDALLDEQADLLEAEARRRAVEGVDRPIHFKGERVDTVKEYSDTLLAFLLKGKRRETFGDKTQVTQDSALSITLRDLAADTLAASPGTPALSGGLTYVAPKTAAAQEDVLQALPNEERLLRERAALDALREEQALVARRVQSAQPVEVSIAPAIPGPDIPGPGPGPWRDPFEPLRQDAGKDEP